MGPALPGRLVMEDWGHVKPITVLLITASGFLTSEH